MTRRRPTETAPPSTPADDLKRLIRAARGLEPEKLNTLAAMAEAFKLEKKKAEIDADLNARKRLLSERCPQSLWDPQAEAPETPLCACPAPHRREQRFCASGARDAAVKDPLEPSGLSENSRQRSRGRPPPVNAETPKVAMKADHIEPSTAPN